MSLKRYMVEGKDTRKWGKLELTDLTGADPALLKDMLDDEKLVLTYQGSDLYDTIQLEVFKFAAEEAEKRSQHLLSQGCKVKEQSLTVQKVVYQPSSSSLFVSAKMMLFLIVPSDKKTELGANKTAWHELIIENHKGKLTAGVNMPPLTDSINVTEICDFKAPITKRS